MEKKLLRESNMTASVKKPILNEATGQKEGFWAVQIWHLGERNLNGRTYTEELAQRLVNEAKETLCMDGHDNYMSEYANAMAHAFEPYIEDGYMWVKFEFIDGAYEKKILFCLDHNIPVGVSSVGYGTMDEKGIIDPEDYELVRYFDFVSTPANETYVAPRGNKNEESGASGSVTPVAEAEPAPADDKAQNIIKAALLLHREYSSK